MDGRNNPGSPAKQFISMIDSDDDSRAIVNTVIDLVDNLWLKIAAEGIEKIGQLQILREMSCHYGQGFYFSKLVAATDIEILLVKRPSWP